MAKFIIGKKLGMSQIYDQIGNEIPVTLIEAGPCFVTQIKTKDKDGYESVQIGFIKKVKRIKKTDKGKEFKNLKEFLGSGEYKIGDEINVSVFQEGDKVVISGISKGKGFAGAVKKEGVRGKAKSHGTKHEERQTGSTGPSQPSRVTKGVKMAGRMGHERVSIKNVKIAKIDAENNIIAVKGAVPGAKGTLVEISNL
ncbi:MAG: 50S ribosomal protein L3 [bacterium]|nr:50S ribosomal protein L3 [bacterium]